MYRLDFDYRAKKEFDKLGTADQRQLQNKLRQRLVKPRVVADRLSDMPDCYKIKLRAAGVRLIYRVQDEVLVVFVVSVGKRDSSKSDSYDIAARCLRTLDD